VVLHGARLTLGKHRLEAIGCIGSLSNAPNVIRFQNGIGVSAPIKLSAILLYQICQEFCHECALLSATCSHEIMVFAVTHEVKEQLIKIPFLGLFHGIERYPDQRWYIVQKDLWRGKAQRVPAWIAELLYANGIDVVSQ
jgi:hypothetical protein